MAAVSLRCGLISPSQEKNYVSQCRFTPTGAAWLPVLHTVRGNNHYSALFSNTARVHELGMTKDWVVIYRDDHDGAGQWTIVTARYGDWKDKRIVRGREAECATYDQSSAVM